MQVILDQVSADILKMEVDVYWVTAAGLEPTEYLRSLGERCVLLHCKDFAAPGAAPLAEYYEGAAVHGVELGNGTLDFPAIISMARHARWLIVEQDFTAGDPYRSVAHSLAYLHGLLEHPPTT